MENFDLRKYLAEGRLLKEEIDVNKILSDGGYDIIDDEELLMTVKNRLKGKSNIDAKKLNLLVMKIEDEEGGNIDFTENKLLKEDTSLTMNQLEKLANIKSDEFNSSPDKLVDMVMGSVKYNLEKDGTNIENASEDEIDKLRYKWARLKGLLKVKDTFTSMYGKRGVKTNTDKDLLDKILRENKLLKERYDKESLLKALGDADDAFIQLSNGRELVIYNPNSNNDENADMWNNDVVYAVSKDGDEVEVLYSDIAGINLEKENIQDKDLLASQAIDILDEIRVYAEDEELIQYLNKSMDYLERIPSNDDVYSAIQAVADGLNPYTGEEFGYEVDDMQSELERLIS